MEILFAVMWSTELSLCSRLAFHTGKSEIYFLEGVSMPAMWFLCSHCLFSTAGRPSRNSEYFKESLQAQQSEERTRVQRNQSR